MAEEFGMKPLTLAEAERVISRAHWQSARSTEDVAPHAYVVLGWAKDDLTEREFWRFVALIQVEGRVELWTPPAEWVRRWGGKPMRGRYLYIGNHAHWFSRGRGGTPMLNREHLFHGPACVGHVRFRERGVNQQHQAVFSQFLGHRKQP